MNITIKFMQISKIIQDKSNLITKCKHTITILVKALFTHYKDDNDYVRTCELDCCQKMIAHALGGMAFFRISNEPHQHNHCTSSYVFDGTIRTHGLCL